MAYKMDYFGIDKHLLYQLYDRKEDDNYDG